MCGTDNCIRQTGLHLRGRFRAGEVKREVWWKSNAVPPL